jgi:flavin reductase (DIM6/NTAB) family NADH-FMN oxidoreductase RutF
MGSTSMELTISALSPDEKYALISDCVVPRPIAWINTQSVNGIVNVAPFSYFNIVSNEPMIVSVSINRRHDNALLKDTARNILQTGECVVHLPSRGHAPQVNASAAAFAPNESEATALGLALTPSTAVKPPRLADCGIALECRLHMHVEVGDPVVADLMLLEVIHLGVADDLLRDGRIHPEPLDPLSRLGGPDYAVIGERFIIQRPK